MKSKFIALTISTILIYGCAETNTAQTNDISQQKQTTVTENQKKDAENELFLLRKEAAELGSVENQVILASTYLNGWGAIPKDISKSIYWFEKAADKGDLFSQYSLGIIYLYGKDVPKNISESIKWFTMAANQGTAKSTNMENATATCQHFLGIIYSLGESGVPKNYNEARKWFQMAAEQGFSPSQLALGNMYNYGNGIPKNYREAMKWYRLSAQQGNEEAQYSLGLMHCLGEGGPRDPALCYMLVNLAAANGNKNAQQNIDDIEHMMSQNEIIRGQELSTKWQAGTPLPTSSH